MPRLEGLKFLRGYQMGTHILQLNIEFINQNMYNKPIKGVACTYMCLQLRQYDIKSGL